MSENSEKCIVITVMKKPQFAITSIQADKTMITEGETVDITVTVANTSDASGTANVRLYVDNNPIDSRSIYISAHSSKAIKFTVSGLTPGLRTICARLE